MSEKEDDIGLIDVLLKIKNTIHFLLLRKWFIISSAAILGVLGLIISFLYPTKYESKLTFIVEQTNESASLGALGGLASSFGFGGLAGDNGLYKNKVNLINYMNSRSLIEKSLLSEIPGTSQTFADRFLNVYQWRSDWNNDLDLKKIRFLPEQNRDDFDLKKDSVLFEIYNFTIEEKLLKISVPDFDEILNIYKNNNSDMNSIIQPLMGGQDYKYNFHCVMFNEKYLTEFLL
jgi:hypothetical protein